LTSEGENNGRICATISSASVETRYFDLLMGRLVSLIIYEKTFRKMFCPVDGWSCGALGENYFDFEAFLLVETIDPPDFQKVFLS